MKLLKTLKSYLLIPSMIFSLATGVFSQVDKKTEDNFRTLHKEINPIVNVYEEKGMLDSEEFNKLNSILFDNFELQDIDGSVDSINISDYIIKLFDVAGGVAYTVKDGFKGVQKNANDAIANLSDNNRDSVKSVVKIIIDSINYLSLYNITNDDDLTSEKFEEAKSSISAALDSALNPSAPKPAAKVVEPKKEEGIFLDIYSAIDSVMNHETSLEKGLARLKTVAKSLNEAPYKTDSRAGDIAFYFNSEYNTKFKKLFNGNETRVISNSKLVSDLFGEETAKDSTKKAKEKMAKKKEAEKADTVIYNTDLPDFLQAEVDGMKDKQDSLEAVRAEEKRLDSLDRVEEKRKRLVEEARAKDIEDSIKDARAKFVEDSLENVVRLENARQDSLDRAKDIQDSIKDARAKFVEDSLRDARTKASQDSVKAVRLEKKRLYNLAQVEQKKIDSTNAARNEKAKQDIMALAEKESEKDTINLDDEFAALGADHETSYVPLKDSVKTKKSDSSAAKKVIPVEKPDSSYVKKSVDEKQKLDKRKSILPEKVAMQGKDTLEKKVVAPKPDSSKEEKQTKQYTAETEVMPTLNEEKIVVKDIISAKKKPLVKKEKRGIAGRGWLGELTSLVSGHGKQDTVDYFGKSVFSFGQVKKGRFVKVEAVRIIKNPDVDLTDLNLKVYYRNGTLVVVSDHASNDTADAGFYVKDGKTLRQYSSDEAGREYAAIFSSLKNKFGVKNAKDLSNLIFAQGDLVSSVGTFARADSVKFNDGSEVYFRLIEKKGARGVFTSLVTIIKSGEHDIHLLDRGARGIVSEGYILKDGKKIKLDPYKIGTTYLDVLHKCLAPLQDRSSK